MVRQPKKDKSETDSVLSLLDPSLISLRLEGVAIMRITVFASMAAEIMTTLACCMIY